MPQPRIHESHAARQAAYRKRRQQELSDHLDSKGLPPLVAGKTNSIGYARWEAAICHVEAQMMRVEAEMEAYYEDRSERWKKSERAEAFQEKLDAVQAALERITDCTA